MYLAIGVSKEYAGHQPALALRTTLDKLNEAIAEWSPARMHITIIHINSEQEVFNFIKA